MARLNKGPSLLITISIKACTKQIKHLYISKRYPHKERTRGQRPNESQKAVIIYMMKSVGEIASKMWPVV